MLNYINNIAFGLFFISLTFKIKSLKAILLKFLSSSSVLKAKFVTLSLYTGLDISLLENI